MRGILLVFSPEIRSKKPMVEFFFNFAALFDFPFTHETIFLLALFIHLLPALSGNRFRSGHF
jgi:hypothetical protein